MPVSCLVMGCGNRSNRDVVKFYSVPAILNHKFLCHKNELSEKRRALWIEAIARSDLTESKLKHQKVCSKHFITGKPSALEDFNNPDWVPSQNMGPTFQTSIRNKKSNADRNGGLDKRCKLEITEGEHEVVDLEVENLIEQETGVATQTDLTMEEITRTFEQLSNASKQIEKLKKKVDNSPFGLADEPDNTEKWKYYTGFPCKIVKLVIFKNIQDFIPNTSSTMLSPFNQLLITLIKLRLDLEFQDLAYQFKISPAAAFTYFDIIIDMLYQRFKSFIIWPEPSVAKKNVPRSFNEVFPDQTIVILDCFEVFIEEPASQITRQQCWSKNKHHHTVKYLIGMTPQGTVSYISEARGGSVSDKDIVDCTDFCNKICPGDVILTNGSFLIEETFGVLGAELPIRAFTKDNGQLHLLEVEESSEIGQVRENVERLTGMVKNKFNIFKGTIPINMLAKASDPEQENTLDKIVTVSCVLINLSPPIISLNS